VIFSRGFRFVLYVSLTTVIGITSCIDANQAAMKSNAIIPHLQQRNFEVPDGIIASRRCLVLCALPGLMLAGTVQAQWMPGHEINCQVSDSQSSIPQVSNPQSADIGELLTPWIHMDAERSCAGNVAEHESDTRIGTMRTNALVLRLPGNVEPANIPAVMDEGQAHSVYKVPGHDGIGYILKARHHEHNTGT